MMALCGAYVWRLILSITKSKQYHREVLLGSSLRNHGVARQNFKSLIEQQKKNFFLCFYPYHAYKDTHTLHPPPPYSQINDLESYT